MNTSHFEHVNIGVENSAIVALLSLIKQRHVEVLALQPMFSFKRFDMCSPCLADAQKVLMCSDFSLNTVAVAIRPGI